MRAAVFDSSTKQLTVEDVPIPEPGPEEVLVRVKACGICLSDVHLIDGSLPATLPRVTPGHESAGSSSVSATTSRRHGSPGNGS